MNELLDMVGSLEIMLEKAQVIADDISADYFGQELTNAGIVFGFSGYGVRAHILFDYVIEARATAKQCEKEIQALLQAGA